MVLAEAMALGVATIGGERSGGGPWTLDGGRCGMLVDIEDPAAVAAAMVRIGRSDSRRLELVGAARKHVAERFRIGPVVSAYESWYRTVITDWPRRAAG